MILSRAVAGDGWRVFMTALDQGTVNPVQTDERINPIDALRAV
jgi:hypothetical protein